MVGVGVAVGDGVFGTVNEGHRRFDRGWAMNRHTLSVSEIMRGGSETEHDVNDMERGPTCG